MKKIVDFSDLLPLFLFWREGRGLVNVIISFEIRSFVPIDYFLEFFHS